MQPVGVEPGFGARGDGIVQPRGRRRRPITAGAYLTEHDPSGHLYRFSPANVGESVRRDLEAARVNGSAVTWVTTSTSGPDRQSSTTAFNAGGALPSR